MNASRTANGYAVALAIVTLLLSVIYGVVTPLWEGSDEPIHFDFVKHVADQRRLPSLHDEGAVLGQTLQPPLYYVIGATAILGIDTSDIDSVREMNPYFIGLRIGEAPNYAIHSDGERFPWQGTALAVHLVRALSALWGAVTVLATFQIGRELWPKAPGPGLGAAAIVGLTPGFIRIHSYVTNDSLAVALIAWTIWATLRMVKEEVTIVRAAVVGVLLGLSLLTKQTALFVVPVLALALAKAAYERRSWQPVWIGLIGISLPVLLLTGWWYARNIRLYGDPWGSTIYFRHAAFEGFPPLTLQWIGQQLVNLHQRYWGRFGWGTIPMHAGIYWIPLVAIIIALGVWVVTLFTRWRREELLRTGEPPMAVWLLLFIVANGVWFLTFASRMGPVGLQPRYLYPSFPGLAALLAGGLWLPTSRDRQFAWLLTPFCLFLGGVSIAAPFLYILPAYAL
jgi:4-amino-4-deoxy-L-arabinose transferase-like glycosyltransferase